MNYIKINNYSLKEHNTLRLDSIAKIMIFPLNNLGVQEVYRSYTKKNIVVLGNGSNILFSQDYYDDNYIFMSFKLMDKIEYSDDQIIAETGTTLSKLSWFALEQGVKGYEFLEDIPGSIGGAVIMNAGTYKDNIAQLVNHITYYDVDRDEIILEKVTNADFGKRTSKWAKINCVILSISLKAADEQKVKVYEDILEEILLIKKQRYSKQPRNYPNAGSVFKRPSLNGKDYYVWKLFEELNLRGYQKNGAMISEKHPGFIVNVNNATAHDVLFLIDLAKDKVASKFGITLELEWKII